MAPGLPGIVGGGGSLPHPPCAAKRATAVASCTILPDWPGQPGGRQPGVLGPPGRRHPGSREARGVLLVTSRSRGHPLTVPDAPVPASGADGAPPRPAVPIRATRSHQTPLELEGGKFLRLLHGRVLLVGVQHGGAWARVPSSRSLVTIIPPSPAL